MQLVNTLQTSKITATEVTEQLETSETTEINIDLAREVRVCALQPSPHQPSRCNSNYVGIRPLPSLSPAPLPMPCPSMALTPTLLQAYRPCAQRASVLFFVLNDMGRIDPMYQFSLDAYIGLFILSIDKSHRSNKLEDRIDYLNEYHTYAVYRSEVPPMFPRQAMWLALMQTLLATSILLLSCAIILGPLLSSPYTFPG